MAKRHHGVVLTHVDHLGQLAECMRLGGYDTVKVVTRWGVAGGWTEERRRELLAMAPRVIVRTAFGDPSHHDGSDADFRFPFANQVRDEIAPWYALRRDITIEIGNEPNVDPGRTTAFIHDYCFHLGAAIDLCRQEFREAELISPGLIVAADRHFEEFNAIAKDVFRRCDYIGLHVYEHDGFAKKHQRPTTNQLRDTIRVARQSYADKRWYVTEYGINKKTLATREKGRRYAGMAYYRESDPALPENVAGLTYYHLHVAASSDDERNYHIFPEGDLAFGNRLRVSPPAGMSAPLLRFAVADPVSPNPAENFASVRQAPRPNAVEAHRLRPGAVVLVDSIEDGWAHLARANRFKDLGFVQAHHLRPAPARGRGRG